MRCFAKKTAISDKYCRKAFVGVLLRVVSSCPVVVQHCPPTPVALQNQQTINMVNNRSRLLIVVALYFPILALWSCKVLCRGGSRNGALAESFKEDVR
ncbi:hypothetical protein PoB_004994100 [Plakobranchus ocellatus]|uniref:Uncharacterized protein n=1 Tax=Plakobranchus ocellatus TaxID=259542 RepID=A0AAV4BSK2_9GAST|nr:hypothetical protein PoB_004994100 [Plakobranchus ocellatus]